MLSSSKKRFLKTLFTVIRERFGCGCRHEIMDSLQTRPKERPEQTLSPASSDLFDNREDICSSTSLFTTQMDKSNLAVDKHSDDGICISESFQVTRIENSVAVEKQSDDPYKDFKDSMLLMISSEKEIVSKEGLQNLLCCFLQLNSAAHHEAIIRAFMEIICNIYCISFPPASTSLLVGRCMNPAEVET